jgi:hypothetical protein
MSKQGHKPPRPFPKRQHDNQEKHMTFKFELKQIVKIAESGETGTILGRAEYSTTPLNSYYIRYKAADGRAREEWWTEDALEA